MRNGKLCNLPMVMCSGHLNSPVFVRNFLLLPKNEQTKINCKILLKIHIRFSVLITEGKIMLGLVYSSSVFFIEVIPINIIKNVRKQ